MSSEIDPIKKIENWEIILRQVKQIIVEGISSEPDESMVDTDLGQLIDLLVDTTDGRYWHTFRLTDHSRESTVELKMSLEFAKYKKPTKEDK